MRFTSAPTPIPRWGTAQLISDPHWRIISPIIAISGLFTFAWTTSSLVNVVSNHLKLVQQLERERIKQFELRAELRRAAGEISEEESKDERARCDDARTRAQAASFLERRRIWREEREKIREMRASTRKKLDELRRREREEEDKLGPAMTPTDEDFKGKK